MSDMQFFYQKLHNSTRSQDPYQCSLMRLTQEEPGQLAMVASEYEWFSWMAPDKAKA
jgi:hypothetical protein